MTSKKLLFKRKRKKIIFLMIIFLISFFSIKATVMACESGEFEICYKKIDPDTKEFAKEEECSCYKRPESGCLESGKCNYVCGYLHYNYFADGKNDDPPRFIGVYRYYDGRWEINAQAPGVTLGYNIKGPDVYNKVFSNDGLANVYIFPEDASFENGCLNYGYYDNEAINEICFDTYKTEDECQSKNTIIASSVPGSAYTDFRYTQVLKIYDLEKELIENLKQSLGSGIAEYIDQAKTMEELTDKLIYEKINLNKINVYLTEFGSGKSVFDYILNSIKRDSKKIAREILENIKEESNDDIAKGAIPLPPDEGSQSPNWDNYLFDVRKQVLFSGNFENSFSEILPDDAKKTLLYIIEAVLKGESLVYNEKLETPEDYCNSLLGNPTDKGTDSIPASPAYYLQFAFNIIKYAAIILVIVFEILDFVKAIASKDNDIMSKALNKLFIRLIICVVIFFVPIILEFLFTLIDIYSPSTCGIS